MPLKNIITDQKVTKAKLERAKELRRNMTPSEKLLWQELRSNKLDIHFRRHTAPAGGAGDKLFKALLSISIVTERGWLSK